MVNNKIVMGENLFLPNGNLLAAKGENVSAQKLAEHLRRGDISKKNLEAALPNEKVIETFLRMEVGAALPFCPEELKEKAVKISTEAIIQEKNVGKILEIFSARDATTYGHSLRVALLTAAMTDDIDAVEGALVHDVGKAYMLPLIQKKRKLTPSEFEVIKKHPQIGYRLLIGANFPQEVAEVALYHHERANGKGYLSISEEDIPEAAAYVAIADAIDAMASNRSYKSSMPMGDVLDKLIEEQDTFHLFNSDIFNRALSLITNG